MSDPRPVLVAGPAGAGKSTVARGMTDALGAVLLDLDTLANPVLDAVIGPRSWNDPDRAAVVRPGRYTALLDVARDQVGRGLRLLLVAPFTAELAGGPEWRTLVDSLAQEPSVVWLDAPPAVRHERTSRRADPRDRDRGWSLLEVPVPRVPCTHVDATQSPDAVLRDALLGIV